MNTKRALLLVPLLLPGVFSLRAEADEAFPLPEFEQLTTHGDYDGSPALKTGLSLVAFVSERSGNRDIWFYDLSTGALKQLTEHSAADYQPSYDPTSDTVFFVSNRDDPEGEIYSLNPGVDYVRRLTEHRGADEFPNVSPDGRWIVFARVEERDYRAGIGVLGPEWEHAERISNIYRIPAAGGETERLTENGGTQPCYSPDGSWIVYVVPGQGRGALVLRRLEDGRELVLVDDGAPVAYPRWRPTGIVFTRFGLDTNSDGRIDVLDNGQVCHLRADQLEAIIAGEYTGAAAADRLEPGQTPYRRVTIGTDWDGVADLGGVNIYFASDRSSGGDVWRTSISAPELEGAPRDWLRRARGVADDDERLLALTIFVDTFHADEIWGPVAQSLYAEELEERGLEAQAAIERERLEERWESSLHAAAYTNYAALIYDWDSARRYDHVPAAEKRLRPGVGSAEAAPEIEARGLDLADEYESTVPEATCAALVLVGDIRWEFGRIEEARALYDRAALLGENFDKRAEAATKSARCLERLGQPEEARQRYLEVLLNYPAEQRWQLEVQDNLVELELGGRSDVEKLVELERIRNDYADYPELAAYAQFETARELEALDQRAEAADAYRKVVVDYPRVRFLGARALIESAQLQRELGRPEDAARSLETVVVDYADLDRGEVAAEARLFLRRLLLEEADEFRREGNPERAESLLRQALDFQYDFPAAHRALIKLSCEDLGLRDELAEEYRERLADEPSSAAARYGLGLTLTYAPGEDPLDEIDLTPAQTELRRIFDERYFYPAAWYALGWIESTRAERARAAGEDDRVFGDHLEKSLDHYRLALAQVDPAEDPYLHADTLLALGNSNYQLGNLSVAHRFYSRRLDALTRPYDAAFEARFQFNLARCARHIDDFAGALEHYDRAAELYAEAGNPVRELMCADGRALVYFEMQDWRTALNEFVAVKAGYESLAVEFERRALELPTTDGRRTAARYAVAARAKVSYPLRNIGICYYYLEDYPLSLAYLGRAMETLEKLGREIGGAEAGGLLDINISAGLAGDAAQATQGFDLIGEKQLIYTFAANCHRRMGDYRAAIAAYRKRLELYEEVSGDVDSQAAAAERGKFLNQLGLLSYQVNDLEASARYYLQSMEACREAEVLRGELLALANLAEVALNIAERLRLEELPGTAAFPALEDPGDPEEHQDLRTAAVGLAAELETLYPRLEEIYESGQAIRYLNALGSLQLALGLTEPDPAARMERLQSAEERFYRAGLAAEAVGDAAAMVTCGHNRGAALAALGDERAVGVLETAYDRSRLFNLDRLSWRIGRSLAEYHLDSGRTAAARVYLDRALHDVERELTQRTQPILQSVYYAEIRALYELALTLEDDAVPVEESLDLVDRYRAAYLAALFGERELDLYRERDRNFFNNERVYQQDITALLDRLTKLSLSTSNEDQDEVERLRGELARLRDEYRREIEDQLAKNEIVVALAGVHTLSLERIQTVLSDDAPLLVYFFAGERLWSATLDGEAIRSEWIELDRGRARDLVEAALAGDGPARDELARLLLEPHSDAVEGAEVLYLAPDGPLWGLPWGALPFEGGALVDETAPVMTPSPTELAFSFGVRNVSRDEPLFIVARSGIDESTVEAAAARRVRLDGELYEDELTLAGLNQRALAREMVEIDGALRHDGGDPLFFGVRLREPVGDGVFPPLGSVDDDEGGLPKVDELQRSTITFKDLLALNLDVNLLALNDGGGYFEPGADLEQGMGVLGRCLNYCGAPTMLYLPPNADPAARNAFLDRFNDYRATHSPAQALRLAMRDRRDSGASTETWATPMLVGFAGFDEDDALEYAEQTYVLTFKSAQANYEDAQHYGDSELYTTAAVQFVKAASIAERLGRDDEKLTLYNAAADAYYRADRLADAREYVERVYDEADDDRTRFGALQRLSGLYHNQGELETALEYNDRALELLRGIGPESRPELVDVYITLHTERAVLLNKLYRYPEALASYERAAGLADGFERLKTWADLQLELGNLYLSRLEEPAAATARALAARDAYTELDDERGRARSLTLLGLCSTELKELESALAYHQEAAAIIDSHYDVEGWRSTSLENDYGWARASWERQDYNRTLELCGGALEKLEDDEALLRSRFRGLGALAHLGLLHREQALEYAEASLEDALLAGGLEPQQRQSLDEITAGGRATDIAAAYSNLALVHQVEGDYSAARKAQQNALEIDEAVGYRAGIDADLRRLAIIAELTEDLPGAAEYHRRYLEDADEGNPRTVMGHYDLARIYRILSPELVEDELDAAADGARRLDRVDIYWRVLHQRARAVQESDFDTAIDGYEEAIELVKLTWPEVQLSNLRQGLILDPHDLFSDAIGLVFQFGDNLRALELSEVYRVVVGDKQLARADLSNSNPELDAALTGVRESAHRLASAKMRGSGEVGLLQGEYNTRVDEVIDRWPEFAGVVGQIFPVENVMDNLRYEQAAIVIFFSDELCYVWEITPLFISQVLRKSQDVEEQVRRLSELLSRRGDLGELQQAATDLYALVMKPFTKHIELSRYTDLLIVPDGLLAQVPFAALPFGDYTNGYLIDNFNLEYTPSLTSYFNLTPGGGAPGSLLSLADPETPREPLRFAAKEANSIARRFEGAAGPYLGEEATEGLFREKAPDYRLLHLATHTEIIPGDPLNTALLFAQPASEDGSAVESDNDGRLTVGEIIGQSFNAELTALSACQTAVGERGMGQEFLSLARAFLFAGSRNVLATFLRVSDITTAVLVRNFFYNLADGKDPVVALRQAQLQTREQFEHPSYWSTVGLFTRADVKQTQIIEDLEKEDPTDNSGEGGGESEAP